MHIRRILFPACLPLLALLGCGASVKAGPDAGTSDAGVPDSGAPPCSATSPCPGQATCCGGHCSVMQFDAVHCGSCANACASTEFCVGSCLAGAFKNLCANPRAVVLYDGHAFDDASANQLATLLPTACTPTVAVTLSTVSDGDAVDPSTGAPRVGPGTTLVVPGGSWGQNTVTYMESSGASPIFSTATSAGYTFFNRSTNAVIVSVPATTLTSSHDYFLIELVRDPASGILCFLDYGFLAPGTTAGTWYFVNRMMPSLATNETSWLVVEWTDTDGNGVADDADTYKVIATGP